jgi:putative membrane protein
MIILVLKSLHIISVIVWMGVLLYMPRLFIYQTEANSKTEPDRGVLIKQYKVMAKNLWIKVGWPAAILTIIFGLGVMHPYFSSIWFWVKMAFVAALLGYHHIIHFSNKALQKDKYTKTVEQFRSMNQAGIVFLLSIVALAVFKDTINNFLIIGGVAILVILVFIAIRAMVRKTSKTQGKAE